MFQSQFADSIEAGFHPNRVWSSKRNWFSSTSLRIASRLKLAILRENPPSSPKCSLMPIRRFPILCGLATDPVRPHCDPQSHALGKGSRRESRVVSLAGKSFSCMSLESDHGRSKAKTLQLSIRHASFTRQGQGEEHESLPSVWHEHSVSCRVPDLRLLHGSHCESTEG